MARRSDGALCSRLKCQRPLEVDDISAYKRPFKTCKVCRRVFNESLRRRTTPRASPSTTIPPTSTPVIPQPSILTSPSGSYLPTSLSSRPYLSPSQASEPLTNIIKRKQDTPKEALVAKKQSLSRTCSSCTEDFPVWDFQALFRCTHEPQTCDDCYQIWITTKITQGAWARITCPESGCDVILEHADVKRLGTSQDFEEYDTLITKQFLHGVENFQYCQGPDCNSGHIQNNEAHGNIFQCRECKYRMCMAHETPIPFHEGETCEEYSTRATVEHHAADEAASLQFLSDMKDCKKCPGLECGINIQKDGGCDHMTCNKCEHEFCWLCLAPYRGSLGIYTVGNHMHDPKCNHYRRDPGTP
ncbi:hypothetical protein K504DRAFT_440606 [Pleomassaria siparia CBS 279.74]|uniref:RBR-type E3 ubiquitin transferase n=1 Tax=Pleomassaria siparia CBS 279.74 TaxID=1314801 RepID=A0A6G1JYJ4_9PLEO|nr:hypothetical protein K504DRAFT_440606 [Pleomassaria siparia CBS 279.74]